MMKKFQKQISSILLAIILSLSLFSALPNSASAFGIPTHDFKKDFDDLLKTILYTAMIKINDGLTKKIINKTMDKYKIRNMADYINTAADEIYTGSMIYDRTKLEATELKARIAIQRGGHATDANGAPITNEQLNLLDQKAAQDKAKSALNPSLSKADYDLALATGYDALSVTPMGRRLLMTDKANTIFQAGREAVSLSFNSNGYQPSYQCTSYNRGLTDKTANKVSNVADVTRCITADPSSYVAGQIDSRLYAKLQSETNPPTDPVGVLALFAKFGGTLLGNQLGNAVLNQANKKLINDVHP